ncbi:MAG: CHAT domain-containing tetratricopeptide repeat protein [Candidatus Krumholzibacteria bacterium]|nr:CHAT domain-containing tetratricopeptide repeat protein [Candidatus Krumholzibacteria bacterium]
MRHFGRAATRLTAGLSPLFIAFYLVGVAGIAKAESDSTATPNPPATAATDSAIVNTMREARQLVNSSSGPQAEVLMRNLLPEMEDHYGPNALLVADALELLSDAAGLGGAGKVEEVRAWLQRAAAIRENTSGSGVEVQARLWHRQAVFLRNIGEIEAAALAIRRGLDLLEAAHLASSDEQSRLLATSALIDTARGEFAQAEGSLVQAEAIASNLGSNMSQLQIRILDVWAELREVQGRLADAIARREQALVLSENLHGADHSETTRRLKTLGIALQKAGRLREAAVPLQRALTNYEAAYGPSSTQVASVANGLGMLYTDSGDYEAAQQYLGLALEITRAQGIQTNLAAALQNMGSLTVLLGDYETSRTCFEQVLAIDEKQYGPLHQFVANDLTNLGAITFMAGDAEEAIRLFDRSIVTATTFSGADHPSVGLALANQAECLAALGRTDEARDAFARGIPLAEAGFGNQSLDIASMRDTYGSFLAALGEFDAARNELATAQAVRVAVLGESHAEVAVSRLNMADLFAREGQLDEALPLIERASLDLERAWGPENPKVAEALADLAELRWRAGRFDEVLEPALRAEKIGREHLQLVARGLPERQALAYAAARPAGLDLAITAALDDPRQDTVPLVWQATAAARAQVLDEMVARRVAAGIMDTEQVAALAAARLRLANLVVRGQLGLSEADYQADMRDTRQSKERLERGLAQQSAAFGRLVRPGVGDFSEVAAALPAGAALVSFQRFGHGDGSDRYAVFVLSDSSALPILMDLGGAAAIDELVLAWRASVAGGAVPPGPLATSAEADCRAQGQRLRAAVWDPVSDLVAAAARVYVVPDGALNLVNLAALPVGEDAYLVEQGPTLHRLTTERDLLTGNSAAGTKQSGLLIVGGPDFDLRAVARPANASTGSQTLAMYRGERSSCGEFADLQFAPLPGAAAEGREVRELWRQAAMAGGATLLQGDEATEDRFKREAAGHSILHLATHGFFLDENCVGTAGGGSDSSSQRSSGSPAPQVTDHENPLLRSGLALAAANLRNEAGLDVDDGVLTAEEIASLDLSGVVWAVLSGCDTGRGTPAVGEGLLGLQRAFQMAGARTVISSLWPVRDQDAQLWMNELYRARLVDGLDTAESVRRASRRTLNARRADGSSGHPLAWAAFVAAGDWR